MNGKNESVHFQWTNPWNANKKTGSKNVSVIVKQWIRMHAVAVFFYTNQKNSIDRMMKLREWAKESKIIGRRAIGKCLKIVRV